MKAIFLGLLIVLMASHAGAQTPQDNAYVEARRRLAADLAAKRKSLPEPVDENVWHREEGRAHDTLKAKLQEALGSAPPPDGFEITRSNPDPVCCGKGADSLDALAISKDKLRAVMTTEGILKLWLGRDPRTALQSDDIDYYRALDTDAPVAVFAALPVEAPPGTDLALGRLVIKGQGIGRFPLHTIAAVVKNERVLLIMTPASLEAANAGSPCERQWQQSTERYRTADDLEERRTINVEAGKQLEQCVKEHGGQALFPGLGRRAQKLVDALSAE
ncbi:MAG: hypothetical protein JSS04_21705 [Proteobacteria bacterium]|nr:hypothetical protein [Pseudomonadota bacterium]